MNSFNLGESLRGYFLLLFLGAAFSFLYHLLLSLIRGFKSIRCVLIKERKEEKREGVGGIYSKYLAFSPDMPPLFLNLYDFFFVTAFSLIFSLFNYLIFDGVIRILSFIFLFIGFILPNKAIKKTENKIFKLLFTPLAVLLISLYCTKRRFTEKKNKKRGIIHHNVSIF